MPRLLILSAVLAMLLAGAAPAAEPTADIVLQPGGLMQGRVVDVPDRGPTRQTAGLQVLLFRGAEPIAAATTGPGGRFAFAQLPPGLYRVEVQVAGVPHWRFFRAWDAPVAPPQAIAEMGLPLSPPVVRGQYSGPVPLMTLGQAATVAAIAGGAIAIPIIYSSVREDNPVPHSP